MADFAHVGINSREITGTNTLFMEGFYAQSEIFHNSFSDTGSIEQASRFTSWAVDLCH